MSLSRHPLSLACTAVLLCGLAPALSKAQDTQHTDPHTHSAAPVQVGKVTVRASALKTAVEDLTQPVTVLTAERLDQVKANSLGETVSGVPGVQSASFGPGVGRPVIRGMDGSRVQVLSNGMGIGDVSAVSGDHAVAVEPFLADQIEVLKGAATLMYGGGSVGGAVNVSDGRIPEHASGDPLSGRSEFRYNSASRERTGMLRLDGTGLDGHLAIHADAIIRNADDLRIPGYADLHGAEDEDAVAGILPNTALQTRSGALGLSWIGSRGFAGMSASQFHTEYGIPEGAHTHGHQGEEEYAEEAGVRIVMNQQRSDAKASIERIGPFASIRPQFSNSRYEHTEWEGDQIGTTFHNRTREARSDFLFKPWGRWTQAVGVTFGDEHQDAIGDEAFIPSTHVRSGALYGFGTGQFGAWTVEAGARLGRTELQLRDVSTADRRMDTVSAALSARYALTPNWSVSGGLDHAERAPGVEELHAYGAHVATQTFEIGDPNLDIEKALRGELGLKYQSRKLRGNVSVYRARFDQFTYLHETGNEVEGLTERRWQQAPATFTGVDAELFWTMADNDNGRWEWRLFGDTVRAKLTDGANLPRISPARIGSEWNWNLNDWRAGLTAMRVAAARNLAPGETPTKGYTLVNAHLSWHHDVRDGVGLELFADATNLLDQEIRNATSILKDSAPQAGRGIAVGVRTYF